MVRTLSLEELEKYGMNAYELVVAVGKRARQINQERQAKIEVNLEPEDDFMDEAAEEVEIKIEEYGYDKRVKPTRQAIEELINGQLEIKYPTEENDLQE